MDTAWFAVDRDGQVGFFETLEAGAIPSIARNQDDHYELLSAIRDVVGRIEPVRDLVGLLKTEVEAHFSSDDRYTPNVLVFLRDVDDAMRARLEEVQARFVSGSTGVAVVVKRSLESKAFFADIHRRELCLGCFVDPSGHPRLFDKNVLGLHRYVHTTDNWAAGPYAVVARPSTPVRADALPREIMAKAIVYGGRFADSPFLQPAELWQSESDAWFWIASDGKTMRPFAPFDADMDLAAEHYRERGFVVVPAPLADLSRGRLYEPEDFPAAHSMDTAWFAVDRDGHVAVFESGESGAAPTVAYLGEDHYALLDDLREALPRKEAVRDLAGMKRALGGVPHVTPRGTWTVLVFLKDADDAMKTKLTELGARIVPASEGVAALVPKAFPNKAFFEDIHARDLCLGCFVQGEEESAMEEHGLFRFEHSEDNWIAGPYVLVGRPKSPVKIDAIPRDIAAHAIVYDGAFTEGAPVQPAEIWQCESWEPAWLASDGKTVRPFAGREKDAGEASYDDNDEIVIVSEPLEGLSSGTLYAVKEAEPEGEPEAKTPEAEDGKPWWKFW